MRILVTGGSGFIGGTLIEKLISLDANQIFNLDLKNIDNIKKRFSHLSINQIGRYHYIKTDLKSEKDIEKTIQISNPDLIFHLAAETHVDDSIQHPKLFFETNVIGTINLLKYSFNHWNNLSAERKDNFRFIHISTDEVFGSLGYEGSFSEKTAYAPKNPYSASKASSDHIVRAWNNTYKFPVLITNCSNNFGPWQSTNKLIPLCIKQALAQNHIPLYGNGLNIRDWLYVDDHIEALLLVAHKGKIGETYCIGGNNEISNKKIVEIICTELDNLKPRKKPHKKLIKYIEDRKGHDFRYSINSNKVKNELDWEPSNDFNSLLIKTVQWYVDNPEWTLNKHI